MTPVLILICLTYLWINAEPAILLKRFFFKEEDYSLYSKYKQALHRLLYCPMCSGFYIGLGILPFLNLNPALSLIVSVGAELLQRLMNKLI